MRHDNGHLERLRGEINMSPGPRVYTAVLPSRVRDPRATRDDAPDQPTNIERVKVVRVDELLTCLRLGQSAASIEKALS